MIRNNKTTRTECIQLRVTQEEKQQIVANAHGNMSEWLRAVALNPDSCHHKARYKELKQDPALVRQVARIGNNVNQIARYINTVKKAGTLVDVVAVQAQLVQINSLLSNLIKPTS
ncbi:plasmid mobilization relaxosome protein MobC [Vibrio vulnificus]|uniref:plasmid mobilization protein n=1 Tax=Vibrio TaxID=662 RepID=UPI001C2F26B0|nr:MULTISPECIES: plasmid mobilization relaxosome protein MobC [Vibrio]EGQ9293150.1 MobC family plasmid mobilization relaxosome protein [Vibrio vulnificus]MCA4022559.1 plasmid mobilization relaxosome protein MobC [Vibrio vulnificus]HDZ3737978.1 plasmid mobilization relaxosome protein MobC [Vibrio vulnificus]HEB2778704.1 plasmid mobilization relaxosome protein MobC [Vibrio vulnificus]